MEVIQVQPHSIEAEEGLIAACLIEEYSHEILSHCAESKITPEHFYKTSHEKIYRILLRLFAEGESIHEIALLEQLRKEGKEEEVGGIAVIYAIQRRIETPAHAKYFAKVVMEKAMIRSIIRMSRETIEACYEQQEEPEVLASKIETFVRGLTENRATGLRTSSEISKEQVEVLARRMQNPDEGKDKIFQTQLIDLNAMFDFQGFSPGEMIVLAARPSVGKTSLAMNFVEHGCVGEQKHPTLVFSFEMTDAQLVNRMVSGRSRVDSKRIRRAELRAEDQRHVAQAFKDIGAAQLYIDDDSTNTILTMRAKAMKLKATLERTGQRLGLIVIDYLQLVAPIDRKLPRVQQIGEISRGVKALAKEADCPVVVLSQLNRESERQGRKPRMSDLREAGDIEQDADVIMLLHRAESNQADESINPTVEHIEILIEKQRDGETGSIDTTFVKKFTKFENFSRMQ